MAVQVHEERLIALLQRLTAEFLNRESGKQSLITVTDFNLSTDHRRGMIKISVLPESMGESALLFAKRRRHSLRDYIKKNARLGRIPHLDFELIKA